MPRDVVGVYTLPQSPFVAGTVISSAAVNSDFSDIASALTDSLARSGASPMTGTLRVPDGSSLSPSYTFTTDTTTGFAHLGAGTLAVVASGVQVGNFTSAGWTGPVVGNGSVPIGALSDFAGASAPTFWLLCFGQAVSRASFAALFAVIGTTYGAGNGSTTFNLPDLRGTVPFGLDNMGGSAAGRLTTAFFGSDPTILGDRGGVQSRALTLAQLPTGITSANTAPIALSVTFAKAASDAASSSVGGGASVSGVGTVNTASGTLGIGAVPVTSNNTSGSQFAIVPPSIVTNKIIYAGA